MDSRVSQKKEGEKMTLKEYAIKVLKGEIYTNISPYEFHFFRLTDSSVCLLVCDHSKKIKSQLSFKSREKKLNEEPWRVIYPDYEYVMV